MNFRQILFGVVFVLVGILLSWFGSIVSDGDSSIGAKMMGSAIFWSGIALALFGVFLIVLGVRD